MQNPNVIVNINTNPELLKQYENLLRTVQSIKRGLCSKNTIDLKLELMDLCDLIEKMILVQVTGNERGTKEFR